MWALCQIYFVVHTPFSRCVVSSPNGVKYDTVRFQSLVEYVVGI
jgi:hypothetical protein